MQPHGCSDISFHITRFPSRQVSYIVIHVSRGTGYDLHQNPWPGTVARPKLAKH